MSSDFEVSTADAKRLFAELDEALVGFDEGTRSAIMEAVRAVDEATVAATAATERTIMERNTARAVAEQWRAVATGLNRASDSQTHPFPWEVQERGSVVTADRPPQSRELTDLDRLILDTIEKHYQGWWGEPSVIRRRFGHANFNRYTEAEVASALSSLADAGLIAKAGTGRYQALA